MKTFITLLFLLSLGAPALNAQDGPWQLRETADGIPVYTRQVDNSPILEYKANVVVDAPLPKVIAVFEDEQEIPRWYYQCVRSRLVANEGPDKKVIYLILHFPWPVAARDFVFRRTKTENEGVVNYSLTALPDRLPPVQGMVRVKSIESLWSFKSLPQNQTEVFFQQHTDPDGSISPSLINKIAVDTPYYSLKSFRQLLTGKAVQS